MRSTIAKLGWAATARTEKTREANPIEALFDQATPNPVDDLSGFRHGGLACRRRPLVVRDAVVPWDSNNQFYAFFRFLSATLRAGEWPFWNPYHYSGHPRVAYPQSLVFSPVFVAWGMLDRRRPCGHLI
jgi:hypothetical protein